MARPPGPMVFSYPGVMEHAEQGALSLLETDRLLAFVTSFAFREASMRAAPSAPCRPAGASVFSPSYAAARSAACLPARWRPCPAGRWCAR